jgi:transcriptional antiterminator RfaH
MSTVAALDNCMKQNMNNPFANQASHKWYVVYSRSRSEKIVERRLQEKGFTTFLPMVRCLKQWSDRKKLVDEPLFKSYVFVHIPRVYCYEAVSTLGIVKMISICGEPVEVSEKDMEIIKRGIGYQGVEVSEEAFNLGDKVIIMKGGLKGITGIVVEIRGQHRVAVKLESLGLSMLVDIPTSNLQKINSTQEY